MLNFQLFIIIMANVAATSLVAETENSINLKLLQSNATTSNNYNTLGDKQFVEFLKYLNQEQHFTTIVILTNGSSNSYRNQREYCVNLKYYMKYEPQQHNVLIPVILLQSQQQDYLLHDKFHSEFLTIICIPPLSSYQIIQTHLLAALSKNLLYLRQNRVIIRMDFSRQSEDETIKIIAAIFEYCHMEQILNVIVISYQFPFKDLEYYSYTKFPIYQIRKQKWFKAKTELFPNQLLDLKGYTLHTIPDQYEPLSMVYRDKNGQQQMCGYMGHFVRYFAKSINASLKFPFEVKEGKTTVYTDIINLITNHTLDLAASVIVILNGTDWSQFSYPVEITNWCILLPVEKDLSLAEIFLVVLNPTFITILILLCLCFTYLILVVVKRVSAPSYRFYWVDLVLNDIAIRAIFGLSFRFKCRRLDYFRVYVFFLLFICGIVVVTLHGAFLGSYMTRPPKKPPIKSFDELDKSSITILISPEEYNLTHPSQYLKYHNLFHVADRSYYYEQRIRLNTSHAYPAANIIWRAVTEQQKHFSRPLFHYTTDLCLIPLMHFRMFLPLHSLLREPLHIANLNAYASGLFDHWFASAFYELVSLGRRSLKDLTEPREMKAIAVSDLKTIFVGCYISLLCSVGVFVTELFVCALRKYVTRYRELKLKKYPRKAKPKRIIPQNKQQLQYRKVLS